MKKLLFLILFFGVIFGNIFAQEYTDRSRNCFINRTSDSLFILEKYTEKNMGETYYKSKLIGVIPKTEVTCANAKDDEIIRSYLAQGPVPVYIGGYPYYDWSGPRKMGKTPLTITRTKERKFFSLYPQCYYKIVATNEEKISFGFIIALIIIWLTGVLGWVRKKFYKNYDIELPIFFNLVAIIFVWIVMRVNGHISTWSDFFKTVLFTLPSVLLYLPWIKMGQQTRKKLNQLLKRVKKTRR